MAACVAAGIAAFAVAGVVSTTTYAAYCDGRACVCGGSVLRSRVFLQWSSAKPSPLLRPTVGRPHGPCPRGVALPSSVLVPQSLAAVVVCRLRQAIAPRAVAARRAAGANGDGKFYQLGGPSANPDVVPPVFGVFGVVVAGWSDDELEYVVAPVLDAAASKRSAGANPAEGAADVVAYGSTSIEVPVRVLAKNDLERTMEEVIASFADEDAVLPPEGSEVRVGRPLLLFSGWEPEPMLAAVREFRRLASLRRLRSEPMVAMAVPRAARKSMRQLIEEIEGDFETNQGDNGGGQDGEKDS